MKNRKIVSIFFVIFYLLLSNSSSSDEIYFEAPEIETLENGTLLKAPKGGKAIIDKFTEILADEIEYNKISSILTANKNVEVIDSLKNIIIKADEIEYNQISSTLTANKNVEVIDSLNEVFVNANKVDYLKNEEKILTQGKTEINLENKYLINSSDIIFLKKELIIYSNKNTSLKDDKENFYSAGSFKYLIKDKLFRGKSIKLISKEKDEYFFEDGMVNLKTKEIQGKNIEVNFNNTIFGNEQNDPRLKGNKIFSNQNKTIISKGVFTTCKKRNNKCPPWVLEAKEVEHDKLKKTIYYKNAWLKIYNKPVLYFPKFFHPDPTVERQSGFLIPQIGNSENLGSSAYIPYFYVISNSKDLTFKPRIFNSNKISLQTEYRQVTKRTNNILDLSITKGHESSLNDTSDTKSHFFSNSKMKLDFKNFSYSDLEIQLQKTSNDTYLKLFDLESPLITDVSTLNSFFKFYANNENSDFNASFQVYEKLGSINNDKYEFILPNYNLNKTIKTNNNLKGNLSFNSAGANYIYETNVVESQIVNDLSYQSENKFLNSGIVNKYNILFKNVNSNGKNSSKYRDKTQLEMLSSLIFESSYPLMREGINFDNYFTPKLSLRYSPNKMRNLKNEKRKIDINNIFAVNRIGFHDTVEPGQSLTIGTEYKKTSKKNDYIPIKFNLATVFRDSAVENMPLTSSLGNKSSDVIGGVSLSTKKKFSADYNFALDNNLDALKYNDFSGSFNVNNFVTTFRYIEENDNIGDENYIQNDTSFKLNENSSILFSTRRNKKIDLTEYYNLIYQYKNDCLTAAIKYKKDFYVDNDIKPSEEIFFSLTIVPLGAYETKSAK